MYFVVVPLIFIAIQVDGAPPTGAEAEKAGVLDPVSVKVLIRCTAAVSAPIVQDP